MPTGLGITLALLAALYIFFIWALCRVSARAERNAPRPEVADLTNVADFRAERDARLQRALHRDHLRQTTNWWNDVA